MRPILTAVLFSAALLPVSCGTDRAFPLDVPVLDQNFSRRSVVLNVLAPGVPAPPVSSRWSFGTSYVESADEVVFDTTGEEPFHFQTTRSIPVHVTVASPFGPVAGAVVCLTQPGQAERVVFQALTDASGSVSGFVHLAATDAELGLSVYAGDLIADQDISVVGVQSIDRRFQFRQEVRSMQARDADGDGVPDDLDAFPRDAGRAALIVQPAGILALDEGPGDLSAGDAHYNDLVLSVRKEHILDAAGRVVAARGTFRVLAKGSAETHDVFWRMPVSGRVDLHVEDGVGRPVSEAAVRLASPAPVPLFVRSPAYFESHEPSDLFDTAALCPASCNVESGATIVTGYRSTVEVAFERSVAPGELLASPADFLISRRETRNADSRSAVRPDMQASRPRVLVFPGEWNWPVKHASIEEAYPQFRSWVASKGMRDRDWYLQTTVASEKKVYRYYSRSPIAAYFLQFGLTHRSLLWAFIAVVLAGLIVLLFLKERTEQEL